MRLYKDEGPPRQKYLLKRWQRALKRLSFGDEPLRSMPEEEWWSQRRQTPLGWAVGKLNKD